MSRVRVALALAAAVLSSSNAAAAGLFRAYLSSSGSDSNPCTVQLPCRLLPAALNAVADGGEIWILDSANFNAGTVTIAKSVSIQALPGQVASIVAAGGGSAIGITAPNLTIGLRNLAFVNNVNNPGTDAINVNSTGSFLSIEDSMFANLPGRGVYVSGYPTALHVKGTVFRNIAGNAISIQDGPVADITTSQFVGTGGLLVQSLGVPVTFLTLSDSVISGSSTATGLSLFTSSQAGIASATVTRTRISGMQTGISCNGANIGATAYVSFSYSAIVHNDVGVAQSGFGACVSLGNNHFENGTDVTGTLGTKALM